MPLNKRLIYPILAYAELSRTYGQLEKRVGPHTHVVARIKDGADLEETMPVRSSEAAVLCWDVIGSSQVPTAVFLPVMAEIFRRVHDLLMVGYQSEELVATGYRLSEAGDGGLISVGFPYLVPGGASICTVAERLAESIAEICLETFRRRAETEHLAIGLGLVFGHVEGSYHQSGAILYRVEGWPLTLATRYEAHRKRLNQLELPFGCPLIIHESVYQRLASDQQSRYATWDATQPEHRIRDDAATRAYFRILNAQAEQLQSDAA